MLAAYSLLASARELVPGLCATLAAVQVGAKQCDAVTHSCCAEAPRSPRNTDEASIQSQSAHPHCAFCTLAKGLIKTEAAVATPENPASPEATTPQAVEQPVSIPVCAESRPRDPPAHSLA